MVELHSRSGETVAAIPAPGVLLAPLTTREAVRGQAEDNLARAQAIVDLYETMKGRVAELTRSRHTISALDWIFGRPIFRSTDFIAAAGVPAPTARRFLRVLSEAGVLQEIVPGSGRRPAVIASPELMRVTEGEGVS